MYTNILKHVLKVGIVCIVYRNVIYTLLKMFHHYLKFKTHQSFSAHLCYSLTIIINNKYFIKVEATKRYNT